MPPIEFGNRRVSLEGLAACSPQEIDELGGSDLTSGALSRIEDLYEDLMEGGADQDTFSELAAGGPEGRAVLAFSLFHNGDSCVREECRTALEKLASGGDEKAQAVLDYVKDNK